MIDPHPKITRTRHRRTAWLKAANRERNRENPKKKRKRFISDLMMKEHHALIAQMGVAPRYRHGAAKFTHSDDIWQKTFEERWAEIQSKYTVRPGPKVEPLKGAYDEKAA